MILRGVVWVEPRVMVEVTYSELMMGGCKAPCSEASGGERRDRRPRSSCGTLPGVATLLPTNWDQRPEIPPDLPLWHGVLTALLTALFVMAIYTGMIWLVGSVVRWISR